MDDGLVGARPERVRKIPRGKGSMSEDEERKRLQGIFQDNVRWDPPPLLPCSSPHTRCDRL